MNNQFNKGIKIVFNKYNISTGELYKDLDKDHYGNEYRDIKRKDKLIGYFEIFDNKDDERVVELILWDKEVYEALINYNDCFERIIWFYEGGEEQVYPDQVPIEGLIL